MKKGYEMKRVVVAVVGGKRSGKTTTVEALISELAKRGYRIAAVKHISEQDFTIDTKGKDTWRYGQAGAKTIIGIAANETATIEKIGKSLTIEEILNRCKNHDVIFLEGFKKLVSKEKTIPKIVAVKSKEETRDALGVFEPILAFAGFFQTKNLELTIPYVDARTHPEKLADLVEDLIKAKHA